VGDAVSILLWCSPIGFAPGVASFLFLLPLARKTPESVRTEPLLAEEDRKEGDEEWLGVHKA